MVFRTVLPVPGRRFVLFHRVWESGQPLAFPPGNEALGHFWPLLEAQPDRGDREGAGEAEPAVEVFQLHDLRGQRQRPQFALWGQRDAVADGAGAVGKALDHLLDLAASETVGGPLGGVAVRRGKHTRVPHRPETVRRRCGRTDRAGTKSPGCRARNSRRTGATRPGPAANSAPGAGWAARRARSRCGGRRPAPATAWR